MAIIHKKVCDLQRGDVVVLANNLTANVSAAHRDPLFEGGLWLGQHDLGEDSVDGDALVAVVSATPTPPREEPRE